MPAAWYVLQSKPKKEDFLWRQLRLRNFTTFYPRIRVNPVNPRSRKVKPYFPGYLFAHLDLAVQGYSKLAWIPGLQRLITFDGTPTPIPEVVIEQLKTRLAQLKQDPRSFEDLPEPGQAVNIIDERFAGYEAIFDARLDGSGRVRVLLKLMGDQQVPLELPESQVKRK